MISIAEAIRSAWLPVTATICLAFVLLAGAHFGFEPVWILPVAAALVAGMIVVRKWRLAPIVGLLFVGAFKSTPAQGISLTDPTMIVLLLAIAAITIELLFVISGSSRFTLHELFAGQTLGIALFLCFAAVLAVSYLYSPAHEWGMQKLLHFVVFQSIVFFGPLILLREEKDLEQLLVTFFSLGVVLTSKSIVEFLRPTQKVLSGEQDITHIGSAQLIGMTLLIFFYAQPFRRFPKILAVPLLGIGLVVCAARGPLLSMIVVMLVYSFAVRKNTGFVTYKQILVGLAVVALVVAGTVSWVAKFPTARARVAEKQLELEAFAGGAKNPGGTMEERLEFYRSAIAAFRKEPLIGLGLDGWTVYYYGFEKSDYPHNIVLEVAAEQGLIGLAALFAFITAVWLASRRIWKTHPEHAFAIPLCVYTFLVCMFSADINLRTLWFWSGTIFALSRMSRTYGAEKLRRFTMPARVILQKGRPALQTLPTVPQQNPS